MRFILLEFERIQKIPIEVEVVRTIRPSGFERMIFIRIKMKIIITDRRE